MAINMEYNGYTIEIQNGMSVEDVCFYKFRSMQDMKHALQGAIMWRILSAPAGESTTDFQILELAPAWVKKAVDNDWRVIVGTNGEPFTVRYNQETGLYHYNGDASYAGYTREECESLL